jgi:isoquinoline 1-oxidoreductase
MEPERFELFEAPRFLFQPTRREFLLGAGLLVLQAAAPVEGQSFAPAGSLAARLHIGEDGAVTVLSGKVEEGQGALTELAMAAAEELRLPLARVRVQLADTARTPDDGITAGSRTTPATVPAVRQTAAALRDLLEKTGVSSYGELAKQPGFAQAASSPAQTALLTPASSWKVLGQALSRIDARALVTGQHQYPSDLVREGMLYGAVLRPPSFGARLMQVDLEPARSRPGTVVVREGDFVACAAPNSFAARQALEAIAQTARWEAKAQPSSSSLFEHLKATAQPETGNRNRPIVQGDAPAVLAKSSAKLKATYQSAFIQHAPMEPRAAVAEWRDGLLSVWTGTSNPFAVRGQLAQAFQLPLERVRVVVPHFGGGFGGKHTGEAALEAARLAKTAGRPVKVRWSREEEFTWAYARPAALIEIEGALNPDGSIAAWDFTNFNSGTAAIATPYRCATQRIRFLPCDAPLRQGSYRALASTANNFARECFIDELAALAGADPLSYRLAQLDNPRIQAVLRAAAEKFAWAERVRRMTPNCGVGLACGTEKNSVVAACVEVETDPRTGTVRLLEICQAYECGAILNPKNLLAQVEGCILMGLGAVLREELLFENGRITNPRFSRYAVPRFRDVPKMDIVLLDRKDAEPVGAGETPIIAVAPAMANAVYRITGQRVRSLPFRLSQKSK